MKEGIHPEWYAEARVVCACGNTWTTGATQPEIRTDICSACHPFYTGEQRIVDTEGQVERFMKRLRQREEILRQEEALEEAEAELPNIPLDELDINKRYTNALAEADIHTAQEFLALYEEGGDDALTAIKGVGAKTVIDVKRQLRGYGYVFPTREALAEAEDEDTEEDYEEAPETE